MTGSVDPKPASNGHWTGEGGARITVGQGDTIHSIARRHGVPASSIIQANNLTARASIRAGQQLVIPRYSASPGGAPSGRAVASAHRPSPVPAVSQAGNPGVRSSVVKPKGSSANATPPGGQTKVASAAPLQSESPPTAALFAPAVEPAAASDAGKSADTTGALPKFRWPANGRVIAAYGPTISGQQNDGINIALPENTPIKAAEDGVVAYAGNELKGYGNLVLVRHPNGYVTAYAHAKELLVKRGDQIKRGQVIARSGQSGNVNAPQLHFEVRKGASPLDPMKFLGG